MRVKVSSKGQIVLPAEIRRKYGIEAGSELDVVEWAGTLYLLPVEEGGPLGHLRGMLAGTGYSTEQFLAERRAERDAEEEEYRKWTR
jgi:AbrB family looped-hinge helix DNA binding protein